MSVAFSGSLGLTGSLRGNIVTVTQTSNTASIDLNASDAFVFNAVNTSATASLIALTNIPTGSNQRFSLLISQSVAGGANVVFGDGFQFPSGSQYSVSTTTGSIDILTFETYTYNPSVVILTAVQKNLVNYVAPALPSAYMVATGGVVTTSGSYKIHTFTSSADFVVTTAGTASVLIVGAGGGGGKSENADRGAGGGGDGQVRSGSIAFAATTYAAVIGAGGTGGVGSTYNGTAGDSTTFISLTSTGGGYGAGNGGATAGGAGASGGGSRNNGTAGAATSVGVTGYNGGVGSPSSGNKQGGGGGGFTATGADGDAGSAGGNGVQWSVNGTYYAGGGAGGVNGGSSTGGTGGGGNGGNSTTAGVAGTANSGGGGGGGGFDGNPGVTGTNGGNGGAGVVVITYQYQ